MNDVDRKARDEIDMAVESLSARSEQPRETNRWPAQPQIARAMPSRLRDESPGLWDNVPI